VKRLRSLTGLTVALCCLLAADGGVALASGNLSAAKKKKAAPLTSKTGTTLFNKLLAAAAPNLSVKNAQHANSADSATNAAHAGTADNVGGMRILKVFYASSTSATPTKILDSNGVQLNATCAAPPSGPAVVATYTGSTRAVMSTEGVSFDNSGTAQMGGFTNDADNLVSLDTFTVTPSGLQSTQSGATIFSNDNVSGTFTYADLAGSAATLVWHAESEVFSGAAAKDCVFNGIANVG
jgi:hypothetical protein